MKSLLLCMLTSAYLISAQNIEFGGYLNAKMQVIDIVDSSFIGHTESFRLEANRDIGETAALETHLLFNSSFESISPSSSFRKGSFMERSFQETTEGALTGFGFEPDSTTGQSLLDDPRITNLYYSSLIPKDAFTLDRVVLKLYFKRADLYIGKQVIAWGTGYAWNPTDFWNAKSPTDPETPKLGVMALRTKIPLGDLSSLDLIYSPGLRVDEASSGVRFKSNLAGYDFSLMTARQMNPDRVLYGLPPKWITGFDMAGDIGDGVGIWVEGAYTNRIFSGQDALDFDSTHIDFDIGASYTFDNGLTTLIEYFYNGLGRNDYQDYSTNDFMNMFSGETNGLGRHYGLLSFTKEAYDFYTIGLNSIVNISDLSVTSIPTISYSWHDDLKISLGANVFIGKLNSEFGSLKHVIYSEVKGYF